MKALTVFFTVCGTSILSSGLYLNHKFKEYNTYMRPKFEINIYSKDGTIYYDLHIPICKGYSTMDSSVKIMGFNGPELSGLNWYPEGIMLDGKHIQLQRYISESHRDMKFTLLKFKIDKKSGLSETELLEMVKKISVVVQVSPLKPLIRHRTDLLTIMPGIEDIIDKR